MATKVVPTSPKQKKPFLLRVIPDSKLAQELEDATDESKTIQQLVMYHFLTLKPGLAQPDQKVKETFLIMKDTSSSHQNKAPLHPLVKILPREGVQKQDTVSLCFNDRSEELGVFEDLNVFHCQEECVSMDPAHITNPEKEENIGEMTLLAVSESDLVAEDQKEDWREKSARGGRMDCSLFPERLSDCQEEKLHAGHIPRQRNMRNLLVTIENESPLEELSKYVDISVIALPRDPRTRRRHSCPLCGKQFHESSYLIAHQRTHTGEKPYHCSHCGKSFNHKTNLNKHERIHTGEKPYSCSQCGKAFRQNCHRSRHEGTHVREKIFKCPECGKTFPNNEAFLLHLQSHVIERPYGCKNCGRRFGRLSNCTRHEKSHSACKNQSRNEVLS